MYQGQVKIKTEVDIIGDNIFESTFTSENNSLVEESVEDFSNVNNKNANNLRPKKINAPKRDRSSDLDNLNNSVENMYQGHVKIKTEVDIIGDYVFESTYTCENNSLVEESVEDFSNVKNMTTHHLKQEKFDTYTPNGISYLHELNTSKNKKDTINEDQSESIICVNNDTMNITPKSKKTKSKKIYKQRSYAFKKSVVRNNSSVVCLKTCNKKKLHNCAVCKKSFNQQGSLNRHMRVHTREKPYECAICHKSFTLKCNLGHHMRIHPGNEPYECAVCHKSFTLKGNLDQHMRIHTGNKPYECAVCKNSFNQQGSLNRHMRVHTREKPYECAICHKSFTSKWNLGQHMRIHTGNKPYECAVCHKSFVQKGNLSRHLRIHSDQKPYECAVCKNSFNRQGSLNRHMKIHTGETRYECAVCTQSYAQKGTLKSHMKVHSRE